LANFCRRIPPTSATYRAAGNHTGSDQNCKHTSGGTIRKVDMFASNRIVKCVTCSGMKRLTPETSARRASPDRKAINGLEASFGAEGRDGM
jgi:hypothetical protein